MKFRIRYAERLVGLFMLVAFAAFVAILALAGANQRWFARDYHFMTTLGSAAAAAPGTDILMRGFKMGKIEKVALDGDGRVSTRFVLFAEYRQLMRVDSVIEIVTSPIGLGTQILFHPGKGEGLLADGAFVPEAGSVEGQKLIDEGLVDIPKKDDTITRLLAGVNPLIEGAGKTVANLNKTVVEINKALTGEGSSPVARIVTGAAASAEGIDRLVGTATATIGDMDGEVKGLVSRLDDLALNLNHVTANLAKLSDGMSDPKGLVPKLLDPKGSIKSLLDDDNRLFDSLEASVGDIEKTLSGLSKLSNSLNAEVPGIAATILEIRSAVKDAQDVMASLKTNPLLRGGVPTRTEQPAVYQSLREGLE
ncbi:MAG TPA: hypothetical protein VMV44_02635 [Rectinemataceae bacterium]|nr:hypothetical protein [Rectinemataceae bacterium]